MLILYTLTQIQILYLSYSVLTHRLWLNLSTTIFHSYLLPVNNIVRLKVRAKRGLCDWQYLMLYLVSGGLVVSVLAFYTDHLGSIPTESHSLFSKKLPEKNENQQKESRLAHSKNILNNFTFSLNTKANVNTTFSSAGLTSECQFRLLTFWLNAFASFR